MSKVRMAAFSITIAFLLILVARILTDENPLFLIQMPGWALGFGAVFVAEDNLFTRLKFESIYWAVNIAVWFPVVFSVLYFTTRLRGNRE